MSQLLTHAYFDGDETTADATQISTI